MANETTTTTVEELVYTEWIRPVLMRAAKPFQICAQHCLQLDLSNTNSLSASVPQEISDSSTIGDLDATEGTVLSNTQLDLSSATCNTTEFGLMREVTDTAAKANIMGAAGLYQTIINSAAEDMGIGIDSDACSLVDAFSNTVGTTTLDLTIANLINGVTQLRKQEMRAPGGIVILLDDQQAEDYQLALASTAASQLGNFYTHNENTQGLSDGAIGTFLGAEVLVTSHMDTANAGADVTGCVMITGKDGRNPDTAALSLATFQEPKVGLQRDEPGRALLIVTSQRKGVVENIDLSGVSYVTDA